MERLKHIYILISKNPLRLLIALPAGIFFSEVVAMVLVRFYEGPYAVTFLLDAIITAILIFPLIYAFSYRPLLKQIADLERVESIIQVRLRLIQFSFEHTVDELLQVTLDELEALTGSTIGFFHFLEADQKTLQLQAWSTNTLQNMCKVEGKGSHYSVDHAGVWVDCIRQRRPVIHNDYASLPYRKGVPEGHAQITREMVVPILRNEQVVAVVGAINSVYASPPSNTANITLPPVPTAPSNFLGTSRLTWATSAIDLSWTDNSNDEYRFVVQRDTNPTFPAPASFYPTANTTTLVTGNIAQGTTYYYRIAAQNLYGYSAWVLMLPYPITTVVGAPPSAPAFFALATEPTLGGTRVTVSLSWMDTSNNEDKFVIQRANDPFFTTGLAIYNRPADTTQFDNTWLFPGRTYYYRIRAQNLYGNSAWATLAVTTP